MLKVFRWLRDLCGSNGEIEALKNRIEELETQTAPIQEGPEPLAEGRTEPEAKRQHATSFFTTTKEKFGVDAATLFYELNARNSKPVGVFGQPKSSSIFFYNIISELMALEKVTTVFMDNRGFYLSDLLNELDPIKVFEQALQKEFITHAHLIATPHTLRIMSQVGMRALVTFRNIPDSLVSLGGELETQWGSNSDLINEQGYAMGFFGQVPSQTIKRFLSSDHENQMDFIIEATTSWYANHAVSWKRAIDRGGHSIHAIDYDDVVSDDAGEVFKAYRFLGGGASGR